MGNRYPWKQSHSHIEDGENLIWNVERLWEAARDLPVSEIVLDSIAEFDENCWFGDLPTCRDVAKHARRIYEADMTRPIILSAKGHLMDGGHRVCRAWLLGQTTIRAVQFAVDPEPDLREPLLVLSDNLP